MSVAAGGDHTLVLTSAFVPPLPFDFEYLSPGAQGVPGGEGRGGGTVEGGSSSSSRGRSKSQTKRGGGGTSGGGGSLVVVAGCARGSLGGLWL